MHVVREVHEHDLARRERLRGVSVTVLLPFEKENAPAAGAAPLPEDAEASTTVTVGGVDGAVEVTETVVVGAAIAFSVGDVETTCIWPSAVIGAINVTSRIPMRNMASPLFLGRNPHESLRQPLTVAARIATANLPEFTTEGTGAHRGLRTRSGRVHCKRWQRSAGLWQPEGGTPYQPRAKLWADRAARRDELLLRLHEVRNGRNAGLRARRRPQGGGLESSALPAGSAADGHGGPRSTKPHARKRCA